MLNHIILAEAYYNKLVITTVLLRKKFKIKNEQYEYIKKQIIHIRFKELEYCSLLQILLNN